ncbi:MAG: hypothetical protein MZV70_51610 [Desulfobacterales bacterium]|nr:hypothetical protein [Desulfobacterales bacterium]
MPMPGAGAAFASGGFLHGHGRLHLHELFHVFENAHAAAVVDRLLDLGRRCDGIDVELGQANAEMAEVLLQALAQTLRTARRIWPGRLRSVSSVCPM